MNSLTDSGPVVGEAKTEMTTAGTPLAGAVSPAATVGVKSAVVVQPKQLPLQAPKPTVAATVNASVGSRVAPPAGVKRGSSREIESGFMHLLLYGETDTRKTTTASAFSGPKNTFFVLTRGKEQLMPVRDEGYPFVQVDSADGLLWALQNPEAAAKWVYDAPGLNETERANLLAWEKSAERTLIIDDTTEGAELIVDDNRTDDEGKELRDGRKIYGNSNVAFREILNSLKRKPMHTIFIGLSKVTAYGAENRETIVPALSSGISNLLTAEMEYVFYLDPRKWKMITSRSSLQYSKLNQKGKPETFIREIFAKRKLPLALELLPVDKKVVKLEEAMELRAVWERIKAAKSSLPKQP
jgi:hypothetical protein